MCAFMFCVICFYVSGGMCICFWGKLVKCIFGGILGGVLLRSCEHGFCLTFSLFRWV